MRIGVVTDQSVPIDLDGVYGTDTGCDRVDRVEVFHYRLLMRHGYGKPAKVDLDLTRFFFNHSPHEFAEIFDHERDETRIDAGVRKSRILDIRRDRRSDGIADNAIDSCLLVEIAD